MARAASSYGPFSITARGKAKCHDSLYQAKVKFLESRQPVDNVLFVLPVNALLQEEGGDLIERFCGFYTVSKRSKSGRVDS